MRLFVFAVMHAFTLTSNSKKGSHKNIEKAILGGWVEPKHQGKCGEPSLERQTDHSSIRDQPLTGRVI